MNTKRIESSRAGILRLKHSRETAEAVEVEMVEERTRFKRLEGDNLTPKAISSFNLFQTPATLAAQMANRLGDADRILEPSAGLGRLYEAVRVLSDADMVLVEMAPDCCEQLYCTTEDDPKAKLIQADFLTCDYERLGGLFDGIIMNPPFSKRLDMAHVRHAHGLLRIGGRMVSVMSESPFFRTDRKAVAFREWLEEVGGVSEKLPQDTFKSEGTKVSCRLVTIGKLF